MRNSTGIMLTLFVVMLISISGCSDGRRDIEPTPNEENPPPVTGIDPASLKP